MFELVRVLTNIHKGRWSRGAVKCSKLLESQVFETLVNVNHQLCNKETARAGSVLNYANHNFFYFTGF